MTAFSNTGKYTARLLFAATVTTLPLNQGTAQQPTESQRILECVADNLPPAVRVLDVTVRTTSSNAGTASEPIRLRFAAEQRGNTVRASAVVREPHDLKDSAYLYRQVEQEPEVYYYNPLLQRVRRVSGSGNSATLFDTAISFQDFQTVENAMRTSSISLRSRRPDDPENLRRFIVLPPPDSRLPVSRINLDVDTEQCVIVHAELLGKDRQLIRRLRIDAADLETLSGGYRYPRHIRIENHEVDRTSEISVNQIEVHERLPDDYFHPERFYRQ